MHTYIRTYTYILTSTNSCNPWSHFPAQLFVSSAICTQINKQLTFVPYVAYVRTSMGEHCPPPPWREPWWWAVHTHIWIFPLFININFFPLPWDEGLISNDMHTNIHTYVHTYVHRHIINHILRTISSFLCMYSIHHQPHTHYTWLYICTYTHHLFILVYVFHSTLCSLEVTVRIQLSSCDDGLQSLYLCPQFSDQLHIGILQRSTGTYVYNGNRNIQDLHSPRP